MPVAPVVSPRLGAPLLVLSLAAASIAWLVFKRETSITLEDALITYRYAENLASFRGLVFNPGERVLGTTSPLLALALGIMGHLLGIGLIPLLSNVLMALAALGSGLVVYAALRRLAIAPAWCALAAAFTLLSPEMLWVVPGGMETPLVLFLMAWSFWGVVAARWTQAGASLALLVLARADGMLWALVMLGLGVSRSSRATAKSLRTMAVVLLPWLHDHQHRPRQEHLSQETVVTLVRQRPPERLRTASAEPIEASRVERVVKEVEIVGHRHTQRGSEAVNEQRDDGENAQPSPAITPSRGFGWQHGARDGLGGGR